MRILAIFILLLGCAAGLAIPRNAQAERRVALVVGNSAYRHAPELANPGNDAAAIASRLEGLGFEVVRGIDTPLNQLLARIQEFSASLDDADVALFFYAGHGLQVDGRNYLVPIDAKLESRITLDYEAVPVDLVLASMQGRVETNLVFLDACRNNPLARNLARSMGTRSAAIGRGLARIGAGRGTMISFATEPGNVALDGEGTNSPYTSALVEYLGTPGESISDSMIRVRQAVMRETSGQQVPWEHSSLTGRVVLVNKVGNAELPARDQAEARPVPAVPSNLAEITYWDSIKDASEKGFYEAYLRRYPDGNYADLAKLKIASLDKPEPEPVSPEPSVDPVVLARGIQTELNRIGCSVGKVDGLWGKGSVRALRFYASQRSITLASTEPSEELLKELKAMTGRVCPLVCARGMQEQNGECVRTRVEAKPIPKEQKRSVSRGSADTPKPQSTASGRECYFCKWKGYGGQESDKRVCIAPGAPLYLSIEGFACSRINWLHRLAT